MRKVFHDIIAINLIWVLLSSYCPLTWAEQTPKDTRASLQQIHYEDADWEWWQKLSEYAQKKEGNSEEDNKEEDNKDSEKNEKEIEEKREREIAENKFFNDFIGYFLVDQRKAFDHFSPQYSPLFHSFQVKKATTRPFYLIYHSFKLDC